MESIIEIATIKDVEPWAQLRAALWPHHSLEDHRAELNRAFLSENGEAIAFIARNAANEAVGFAEATLRHDYVNGCSSSPVLFLEGIYVRSIDRRKGIARLLCNVVADWGKSLGCVEFGSDALLENSASHAMHAALGFKETQRVVFFRKPL
ncbi:aminoglycoside 6'-acetyltransferase [Rhizobium sp. R634]|uniref:aminoglycoside 6'-N-acetyltransferase n=1 Tax=Rhizobium sp. R634 TaxID=1764274 RepID=UPI000B673C78|nr:aminoglycoside 6'-N-acetyltransferase [Rhizobium sp. R634]OWV79668.1 aminoglycoside 6'-acetyltransferase [Rhizobium sp. R634]